MQKNITALKARGTARFAEIIAGRGQTHDRIGRISKEDKSLGVSYVLIDTNAIETVLIRQTESQEERETKSIKPQKQKITTSFVSKQENCYYSIKGLLEPRTVDQGQLPLSAPYNSFLANKQTPKRTIPAPSYLYMSLYTHFFTLPSISTQKPIYFLTYTWPTHLQIQRKEEEKHGPHFIASPSSMQHQLSHLHAVSMEFTTCVTSRIWFDKSPGPAMLVCRCRFESTCSKMPRTWPATVGSLGFKDKTASCIHLSLPFVSFSISTPNCCTRDSRTF